MLRYQESWKHNRGWLFEELQSKRTRNRAVELARFRDCEEKKNSN